MLGFSVLPMTVSAQADDEFDEDEIIELNPFIVEGSEDTGYLATATLGGTRIRTDLRDLSTPITAITKDFLQDTGSTNNEDLLVYTTSTEVGGLYGNFGGFGNEQGLSDRQALLAPNNNTRVRGLDSADNTRNYFRTSAWWDGYNVDRVEIQRGPNSILFGAGSPSGIINANTIVASMDGVFGKLETEIAKYGSTRVVLDVNAELIDDLLAIRGAGLLSNRKYQQKPAFTDDERYFVTASFTPQLFSEDWAGKLNVRASYENADITANNPRILPPIDGISLWFDDVAGDGEDNYIGLGKQMLDPYLYEEAGYGAAGRGGWPGTTPNPFERFIYAVGEIDSGPLNNGGIGLFFMNGQDQPFWSARARPDVTGGLNALGEVDNGIDGYPYGQLHRAASLNQYTKQLNRANPELFPLAQRGYYKDQTLSDPTIFDFYNQLIDGDNKRELTDWDTIDFSIAQTFFDNRLGFEVFYNKESFQQMRRGHAWNSPYISIDINKNLTTQIAQYTRVPDPNYDPDYVNEDGTLGIGEEYGFLDPSTYSYSPWPAGQEYPNPMAGAAITGGSYANNQIDEVEYENYRATVFGEFRASDIFDEDSLLAYIIGKHTLTGLFTREKKTTNLTQYYPTRTSYDWAAWQYPAGDANADLAANARGVTPIIYLSEPLTDPSISSAHGLNLPPVRTHYTPRGTFDTEVFITEWNAPSSVGYGDPFTDWTGDPTLTQAENPANYVGWKTRSATVLNADAGDIDELIYNATRREDITKSYAVVWQGHFLDGHIVPTVGWREDKLEASSAKGDADETGVIRSIPELTPAPGGSNIAHTLSWGIVGHVPQSIVSRIPVISGFSAYYNYGENMKPEYRLNYDGMELPNQEADSEDVGIVISMFDDKLTIKASHFETNVVNGNLPYSAQALGAETWRVWQMEAWLMGNALMYSYGLAGETPGLLWAWGLAHIEKGWDESWWTNEETGTVDPTLEVYRNDPVTQEQLAAMDDIVYNADEQFFINYEIPIDVPAVQAAYKTWRDTENIQPLIDAAPDFGPGRGVGDLGTGNNGTINGVTPNGTIDSTSKGYEFEINYRPVPNWNIQINAAKTDAYRKDIGQPMRDFIYKQVARLNGPAGDVHMWWGGDDKMRKVYNDTVVAALNFTEESVGQQAPELRPWRFSVVTNYSFNEGSLKGFNFGGAYRWADDQIRGYRLKSDEYLAANPEEEPGLNALDPIKGGAEGHFDLWVGHEMDLTDSVSMRIQLNLRNVGESNSLVPISANPDGTIAAQRISEGMSWSLTHTLSF